MGKTYTFARQLGLGKWGERQVIEYLQNHKDITGVKDVTEDKEWQAKGVDVILEGPGHDMYRLADIKMDMKLHLTGNVFIETVSSKEGGKTGNLLSTKADEFLYFDPFGHQLYTFNVARMKAWYEEHKEELTERNLVKTVKNKNYTSEGFIMNPDILCAHGLGRRDVLTEQVPV